jgi:uncharacterized lipoprotein YmbA
MRTRLSVVLGLVGLALALAGCVSLKRTPEARFFVLQSLAQPPTSAEGQTPVGLIGVEMVRLPGHLERPQLVTWTAPTELKVDEFLRWAEPLEDGITRTVAENLAALLPEYQVIRRPWPGDVESRCRVMMTLRRFGLQRDGTVRLDGRVALLPHRGDLALMIQPVSLTWGPQPGGVEGTPPDPGVEAMNELLLDLSRRIAADISALPPEEPLADAEAEPAVPEESVTSEEIENP